MTIIDGTLPWPTPLNTVFTCSTQKGKIMVRDVKAKEKGAHTNPLVEQASTAYITFNMILLDKFCWQETNLTGY